MNRMVLTVISIVIVGIVISSASDDAHAQQQVKIETTPQKNTPPPSRGKLTLDDWLRIMK